MRKLLVILLVLTAYLGHSQDVYHIFKSDGSKVEAKKYATNNKWITATTAEREKINIPYDELDRVEYKITHRKKTNKIVEEFVLVSDNRGYMMKLIHDGACKSYTHIGPSAGHTVTYFYAKMRGDRKATCIGSRNFVNFMSYKKTAKEFFEDCPSLLEKIDEKFKRKKVHDLVAYYNSNCN
ncbi:hypothetical protein [Nonlabens ponticola]|uniref:Uncharacterized protein n=1 Tax=Nonlabens ponticola TaxID=2496866 RepID=A0A3S9MVA0_9FLAO|nr:hypothetical protein [Nonlabens ponticola]AZQ43106.1 hypothetical protein EJ995_02225 [Nonlabens ponticola]